MISFAIIAIRSGDQIDESNNKTKKQKKEKKEKNASKKSKEDSNEKDSSESVHPSWQAKQRMKQALATQQFVGKKIVFADNDDEDE